MYAILAGKAKAICTNYGGAVDNHPLTYLAMLTNGSAGVDNSILANNCVLTNVGMRIKGNAILNDRMVVYKSHWHNGNILTNSNILADVGLRTNALFMNNWWRKEGQHNGKGCPGVLHKNRWQRKVLLLVADSCWQKHSCRLAPLGLLYMIFISKGNVPGSCPGNIVDTGNLHTAIPLQPAVDAGCNLL